MASADDDGSPTEPTPAQESKHHERFATTGEPCRLEDCPRFDLRDAPETWWVQGHSHAGERSGYYIHGLNVVVDCGLSTWRTPNAFFVTHRHTDHTYDLCSMVSCRVNPRKGQEGLGGRPVAMPPECVPMIAHFCKSIAFLSDGHLPHSDAAALKRQGIVPIAVAPAAGHPVTRYVPKPIDTVERADVACGKIDHLPEDDARAAAVDATERRKVAAAIDAKQRGEIRRRFAALEDGDDDDATGAVGGFRRGGDASSDDADSSERHRDPADYGYKPLLGSDDGDDADGGAEAADGEEGGAAAAPPPLEDDKGELYG